MTLAIVLRLLLLPVSTIESPNMMTAGIVTFGGNVIRARAMHNWRKRKIKNKGVDEEEEGGFKKRKNCIVFGNFFRVKSHLSYELVKTLCMSC